MAKKSKVSGYTKGMLSDPDPRHQLPGTYRYAKNIKLINSDGLTFTVENINGNTKVVDLYQEFGFESYGNINEAGEISSIPSGYYPEVPDIWQTHVDLAGVPNYSTIGKKLDFAGNIVGHFSFKNQLFLIIVGFMKGNSETSINHNVHSEVRWRTQFALLDFDNNGNVLSAKDLFVCYNENIEYPDLNMDPLLSCRVEGLIENDCLTRVYWTDNLNPLRTLQIESKNLPDLDPTELDIKPMAHFNEPVLTGSIPGSLLSGVYRYAFKYLTEDGGESGISPISDTYHVSSASSASYKSFYGSESGAFSSNGFEITIHNVDQDFDSIELYAVYYQQLNLSPVVLRVGNEKITQAGTGEAVSFKHVTTENELVEGLAEVLIPSNSWDVCKDITIKDNILFAGNLRTIRNVVTEKEWNVKVRRTSLALPGNLSSNGGSVEEVLTTTDPDVKDYYCTTATYSPDNVEALVDSGNAAFQNTDYRSLDLAAGFDGHRTAHRYMPTSNYSPGGDRMLGAASYEFEDNNPVLGGCRVSFTMCPKVSDSIGNKGKTSSMGYGTGVTIDGYSSDFYSVDDIAADGDGSNVINNTDTVYRATLSGLGSNKDAASSARRGYQRNETYRFGVLVYDKAGNPGNVLWIGDMQMPTRHDRFAALNLEIVDTGQMDSSALEYSCSELVQDFRTSVDSSQHIPSWSAMFANYEDSAGSLGDNRRKNLFNPGGTNKNNIYTFDLGVVFEFKIPDHVREKISGFQVVRAERKENDRTIVQQGILKQCIGYGGYATDSNMKLYHSVLDSCLDVTGGNAWPAYEANLRGRVGINCTHQALEHSPEANQYDVQVQNGSEVRIRRDADGRKPGNTDCTASKWFGSYDMGHIRVNGSANNYGKYNTFVSPSTHVMYSPDSAFGIRPYVFRSGDVLIIDAVLKLSDKLRWNINDQVGNEFWTRDWNWSGVWASTDYSFEADQIDAAAYGYNLMGGNDQSAWFSSRKETDGDEDVRASVMSGIYTEYDTYYYNYITNFDRSISQFPARRQYVSVEDNANLSDSVSISEPYPIAKGLYTGDENMGIPGTTGTPNFDKRDPFIGFAMATNARNGNNDNASSSNIVPIGNAKEIGAGELVDESFFQTTAAAGGGWQRPFVNGGFSNHSLGFGYFGNNNATNGANSDAANCHPQSAGLNKFIAGSAWNLDNPDNKDRRYPETVSQMATGTRGILISALDDDYTGAADNAAYHTVQSHLGFAPTSYIKYYWSNPKDLARIIHQQFYGAGGQCGGNIVRHHKIPYASLGSICRKNVNQYGGDSLSSIEKTVYSVCGHFHRVVQDKTYHRSVVFGGDTFVTMYSHQTTFSPDPQYGAAKWEVFPVESYVNTEMRAGLHLQAGDTEEGWDQENPPFHNDWFYNAVYSQEKNLKRYMPVPEEDCNIINLPYQVAYSQTKISGERTDAFRSFPLFNFHDVEGTYGEITSLVTHKNEVYFTQESAFGRLDVNVRTFLSDEASGRSIFTGSGETVEAHMYVSNRYGTRHGQSVVQSENNIYLFDVDKEKIIQYNGKNLKVLSDEKGIKSLLNKYLKYGRLKIYDKYDEFNRISRNDMPLNFIGVHGVFDFKSRNLIYTILDGIRIDEKDREDHPTGPNVWEDDSGTPTLPIIPWTGEQKGGYADRWRLHNTLVFNEEVDSFVSFLSMYPPFWIHHNGYTYSPRIRDRFNHWTVPPASYPNLAAYGTTMYFIGDEDVFEHGKYIYGSHHIKEGALELWKLEGNEVDKNWFYEDMLYDTTTDTQLSNQWPTENRHIRDIHKSVFEVITNDFPLDNKKFDNVQIIASANNDGQNLLRENEFLFGNWVDLDDDPNTANLMTSGPIFEAVDFHTDYTPQYTLDLTRNVFDSPGFRETALHKYREGALRLPIRTLDGAARYRQTGTYLSTRLHSRTDKKFNIFAITTKFRKSFN